MTRDILGEATRALRAETARDREMSRAIDARRAQVTRERIVADLSKRKASLPRGIFLVPLAAILIGTTAWASGVAPAAWHALAGPAEASRERLVELEIPMIVVDADRPRPPEPAADVDPPQIEASPPEPPPSGSPATVPGASPAAPRGDAPTPIAAASKPLPEETNAAEDAAALYRAAHQAHFAENDPGRALNGWNAYLAAAPSGRFAPEAAYNRALCLARLGQRSAAVAALQPFVNGAYGAYRQAEAQQIVDALSATDAR